MKKGKELQVMDRCGEKQDVSQEQIKQNIMKKGKELQITDRCGEKEGLSQKNGCLAEPKQ